MMKLIRRSVIFCLFLFIVSEYFGDWLWRLADVETMPKENKHGRRAKRALRCSDRPKFDCKGGIPQKYTRIDQTDGRKFTCDLNDYNVNPRWIQDLIQSDDYRLSYKLGNLQRLSIYGWISHHHPSGPDKPGSELSYCPTAWYGLNAKSALVNSRLINHCNPSCCKYAQGDSMDTYEYYGKLNKKTQKFKPGKAWIKCRDPKGPNAPIVARALCRPNGKMEIQIPYNNRSAWDPTANGKWYDVRYMHSVSKQWGKGKPEIWTTPNYRCKLGFCCGKHCYDKDAIPEGSNAKTMWQRVDEVCKRDEEPYMECTGKGMTPALPVGADRVECEKRRCWSICKDGLLPEYPQRFKCVMIDFKAQKWGWHIQPKEYSGLSKCINCPPIPTLATVKVEYEEGRKPGLTAAKFYCDETLYTHLAFDFGKDKTTGKSRQKHYIRTSNTKAKWLTCNCEITVDKQNKNIQRRKCDWQFKNKKFNSKHFKDIHCFNSDQKPWNSLQRITSR